MEKLYSFPAGAIFGEYRAPGRTIRTARAVQIGEDQHGPEILENWTNEELAAIGIKRVVQDVLPVDETGWPYLPGVPEDVETDTVILRSFPNAEPDTAGSAANQENLARAFRAQRDNLLLSCDWTQLPDAPLTTAQRATWAAYRQELRDITAQPGFPREVSWPVAPE